MSIWKRIKRMFGAAGGEAPIKGTDAQSAARSQHAQQDTIGNTGGAPPNWVPPTDEGRPRH